MDSVHLTSFHYNDVIMGSVAFQITSLTIVYSSIYSGADKKKHQSSASLAFAGNSPFSGEFPVQMASNAENVSIWWRHHVADPLVSGDAYKPLNWTNACQLKRNSVPLKWKYIFLFRNINWKYPMHFVWVAMCYVVQSSLVKWSAESRVPSNVYVSKPAAVRHNTVLINNCI